MRLGTEGWMRRVLSSSLVLFVLPLPAFSFYLPGVAPTSYKPGDRVPLTVNHLTPDLALEDSQLHSVYSFDYYHPAFRFCKPDPEPKRVRESLGGIIFGDRIFTSPFELYMTKNETCKALCKEKKFDERAAKFVNMRIRQNYNLNWLVDGLPAAQLMEDSSTGTDYYSPGFYLGSVHEDSPRLNNHYDILIDYHKVAGTKNDMRVVGVRVQPSSRKGSKIQDDGTVDCADPNVPLVLDEEGQTTVTWTYSIYWIPSATAWATRWDKYLHVFDPRIHWFSLVNSAIIVVFLSVLVSTILLKALRKDITRYNRLDSYTLEDLNGTSVVEDGVQEDSGWKLVHGDVFRSPRMPLILSVLLGNGAQLFVMTGTTIFFALLGFLSPSNRGSLGTATILLYAFFGSIGGYVSARIYKSFGGEAWKRNIAMTPILVPGIVFSTFFVMNIFLWAKNSSGAVPLATMLFIIVIWFVISVPLSFVGSYFGFKAPAIQPPVRVNQIPRQIPPPPTSLKPLPSLLLAGILPFGAIFVELYFILSSIWFSKFYYMFGFLFVCYGLMILTCATTTILLIYFLLCAENYHWQWRAFAGAGSSGLYVLLNAILFWITRLKFASFVSGILYLGYSCLISFLFAILTGSIGFFASWAFVHKIYSAIKID